MGEVVAGSSTSSPPFSGVPDSSDEGSARWEPADQRRVTDAAVTDAASRPHGVGGARVDVCDASSVGDTTLEWVEGPSRVASGRSMAGSTACRAPEGARASDASSRARGSSFADAMSAHERTAAVTAGTSGASGTVGVVTSAVVAAMSRCGGRGKGEPRDIPFPGASPLPR